MKIWIDIANSPHVPFFLPVISSLKSAGHQLLITSRDFAQTVALLDHADIQHTIVGRHGGGTRTGKVVSVLARAAGLLGTARVFQPDVAVSHNSYSQSITAKLLRIPILTIMDYEHQAANHLNFRLAKTVLVPDCFPDHALRRFGAGPSKVEKYRGFKEETYIAGFKPIERSKVFQQLLGDKAKTLSAEVTLGLVRTPATMSWYHQGENPIFDELLDFLDTKQNTKIILIPRTPEQKDIYQARSFKNILIPDQVADGMQLINQVDFVVSGGGTMNREAALLGKPVYTILSVAKGAVDLQLIERGWLEEIRQPSDFDKIANAKSDIQNRTLPDTHVLETIVRCIENLGF